MTEAGKSGDVAKLEAVIAEGRAILSEEDMKVFDEMLDAFKDRDKAILELASAVKSKDIEELKVAIAMGEKVGVDVTEAKKVLAEEEPKKLALDALAKVMENKLPVLSDVQA